MLHNFSRNVLGQQLALPKRKLTSLEEFVDAFPEVERVILDGTERPIQRAKDRDQHKEDYLGKKKRHTRTHLAVVAPDRSILVFSAAYPGKTHDKGLLNTEGWAEWIPDDVKIQGDLRFQGLQNEYVNVEIPHKKPKGGQLSDERRKPRIKPSLSSEGWASMPLRSSNPTGLSPRSIAIEKKTSMTAPSSRRQDSGTFT
jgi:hypothetical protein